MRRSRPYIYSTVLIMSIHLKLQQNINLNITVSTSCLPPLFFPYHPPINYETSYERPYDHEDDYRRTHTREEPFSFH